MRENELVELGFEKFTPDPNDWDGEEWHYYTYDFGNGSFSLISDSSDSIKDDNWTVEVFEDDSIRFETKEDVSLLIDLIKRNTVR